ncbi:MAG: DUF4129 domain-containing protein, partial [Dactylosporangium sp.]|nr:DUF4129 domain-containing protein [Dactylosporangium sp.]NNJ60127.1 DUF4129 domain-containing protein [Dactylosporangium sp.]
LGLPGRPEALGGDPAEANAGAARRDAHEAWTEMLDLMVDFGVPLKESETPRATANRLAATLAPGPAADGARRLGQAEEHARYARRPWPAEALASSVLEVRAALVGRAGRWIRLRAALLPPSVIRRWRMAMVPARFRRWPEP